MNEMDRSYEILRVFKSVKETMRHKFETQFKDLKLTGPQGMLVGILAHHGPLKISDISDKMHLSNSTVSSILDRLENQGHVHRIKSEEDKRVVMVDLSPEFREIAKEKFCGVENQIITIMKLATPDETAKILEGMQLLDQVLQRAKKEAKFYAKTD